LVEFLNFVFCAAAPALVEASYKGLYFECGGRPEDVCMAALRYRERAALEARVVFALQWAVA
jgi:hypothetical protein